MRKFYRTQNDIDSANFRSARDTNNIFVRCIPKVCAELVCGKLIFSHLKFQF